jgi:hypothetical protein
MQLQQIFRKRRFPMGNTLKHHLIFFIIITLVSSLFFACPTPETGGDNPQATPQPEAAALLVDEALGFMRLKDWEGALSKFSQAYAKDWTNEQALIGYSALNLAKIGTDEVIADIAVNKLGFCDFPAKMRTLYSKDWFKEVVITNLQWENNNPISTPVTYFMPDITGMEAFRDMSDDDNDGEAAGDTDDPVGIEERMYAMAAFAASHNPTGLNEIINQFKTALGSRLDAALSVLNKATDTMKLTLTWDMYYSSLPANTIWPYDNDDQPMEIVIGKAEILFAASVLKVFRAATYLASVYDLSLPVSQIWDVYHEGADSTFRPFANESNFLHLTPDAGSKLAKARTDLIDALNDSVAAMNAITSDRNGFTFSSNSGLFDTDTWEYTSQIISTIALLNDKLEDSLALKQTIYIPYDLFNYDYTVDPGAWPTIFDSDSNFSLNVGNFFSTPLNLVDNLLDLTTITYPANGEFPGEPVWYKLDTSNGNLVYLQSSELPADGDFSNTSRVYWMKVKDVTLNGTIPLENLTEITAETIPYYSISNFSYMDTNTNYRWDPGEVINTIDIYASLGGVIKKENLGLFNYDPIGYFLNANHIPDSVLLNETSSEYYGDLRAAINNLDQDNVHKSFSAPFILDGTAIYIPCPDYFAWNSFVAVGATGFDWDGNPITSSGSFFWMFLKQFTIY